MEKVVAMKMPSRFYLEPTRDDALSGVCNSPQKCMYAMNVRRMFPKATYVGVNPNGVTVTLEGFYYHYTIPMRGVLAMSTFDKAGQGITDDELKTARVALRLREVRSCSYVSTPEAKAYHRRNSARRRADPNYVRPDSRNTLRAVVARSRPARTRAEVS